MARRLRSGYTTGACAAAAAKAAAIVACEGIIPEQVTIPFPDGSRHSFGVRRAEKRTNGGFASVIKDAGDDPDVTNGAEICAAVTLGEDEQSHKGIAIDTIRLFAGEGVGWASKPGLAVAVGEPAINPVPRQMIAAAVHQVETSKIMSVTISIPRGEELAEKTLNHRLGIIDGLSILGTTGIVRPVSAEAWTATIEASMSVARELGYHDIVLSTGRTSEKGVQSLLDLGIEAYAMMGDYLEFSLKSAAAMNFERIHLAGMWAKIIKAALRIPQTHVRNGPLEIDQAAELLAECGADAALADKLRAANTAREMYSHLQAHGQQEVIRRVCKRARSYAEEVSDLPVRVYLIDAKARVVIHV